MTEDFLPTTLEGKRAHIVEECGELLAALGKCQRFGWMSSNPLLPPEQRERNFEWVFREMQDVKRAVASLEAEMLRVFDDFNLKDKVK